jgi:L-amino acid N-acyltransferase YncA
MTYRLRRSTIADTEILGRIHAQAWRESYAEILPESVLSTSGSVEGRTAKRLAIFEHSTAKHGHFIVEDEKGRAAGFGDCGPAVETGDYAPAEVTTLYLLREAQGKRLGRMLFQTMMRHLAAQSFPSAALKVFTANASRSFYEKLGGQKAGEMNVTMAGQKFPTVVYVWRDLKPFALLENPGRST